MKAFKILVAFLFTSLLVPAAISTSIAGAATTTAQPPLTYYTFDGDGYRIRSVNADGSSPKVIATFLNTANVIEAGYQHYSPDHTKVAWYQAQFGPFIPYIYVKTLATGAVAKYTIPNQQMSNGYLEWYPDNVRIAAELNNSGVSTVQSLNTNNGAFTTVIPAAQIKGLLSLTVSDNSTIGFTDTDGVKVVRPGSATATLIHSASFCDEIVGRPGQGSQFAYKCSVSGSFVQQVFVQTVGKSANLIVNGNVSGKTSVTAAEFAWSPTGSALAFETRKTVKVDNCHATDTLTLGKQNITSTGAATGAAVTVFGDAPFAVNTCNDFGIGRYRSIAWSPNSAKIAFIGGSNRLNDDVSVVAATGGLAPVVVGTNGQSVDW